MNYTKLVQQSQTSLRLLGNRNVINASSMSMPAKLFYSTLLFGAAFIGKQIYDGSLEVELQFTPPFMSEPWVFSNIKRKEETQLE
ncbi:hypothetical protein CYY_002236 [Polysphondylium violaceum]|uniref:Uncharacterized protein n=1 Tax=Polysphondylium violaceum TaxID=133409 RepID=A0A8J4PYD0_9MYCE|nr:hypothetical protein CYY_002236 [Polysphondylium violaceum]